VLFSLPLTLFSAAGQPKACTPTIYLDIDRL
jgi:hypothetical protein